ncbi:MAG: hypothetical protein JRN21_04860 [Nitrososphaerota archaeon]|nr:hypothetical protein [Nitrososphaerota archaeon]
MNAEPSTAAGGIGTWHATVLFQSFVAFVQFVLAPWYAFVMLSPGSISEYIPSEQPPSGFLVLRFVVAAAVWLPIIYFTWKRKRAGAAASAVYSAALLIIIPAAILSGSGRPDFSDFVLFPIDALLVVFSVATLRALAGERRSG